MSPFISLLKTNLNVHFGISALKYRFTVEKKRLWEPVLILLAILIGGGSMVVMYSLLLLGIFVAGQTLGHPEMVLTLAFMATQLLILIFGIFNIISVFYFSNDMDIILPLPLSQGEVMGAKFIIVLISEYLIALPFLLPAFLIYGTGTVAGPLYWLKGLILVLTAPILPLVISAIFVVLLMRVVNIRKSKDMMMVIGSLLGLFIGLGINLITQRLPSGTEEEFVRDFVTRNAGLIEAIGNRFPPSIWATYGLSMPGWGGFLYFLLFVGVSALLSGFLIWIGNRFFYRGYLSGQEVLRKNRRISKESLKKRSQKISAPIVALFQREWRLFFRTPVYVMNGLAGMIMVPFFMLMPLITKSDELKEVVEYAKDPEYAHITALITLGILLFGTGINSITGTAVSREGRTFWISKTIPASPQEQVLAKLLHGIALSLIEIIIIAIPMHLVLGVSFPRLLVITILALLAGGLMGTLALMVDLWRPKLDWTDPQEAIKQNLNVFFGALLSFLVMGIMALIALFMTLKGFSEGSVYGTLAATLILLFIPALYGLFALARIRYSR